MILTQTAALFVDAYRELNARKLFWITMVLNLLAVAIFAGLGINERGPSFLHWTFDNEFFNTGLISKELFYKLQFTTWGIPVWLSWVATILALISTAGMFPDLISGGVIETMLSKPIARWRLFFTKYLAGLLFVTLQVTVFSLGCFLVIWIRGGAVQPSLFLAVPIVVLFFSYLFAVCALLGLLTRSTIAALLLTILFWFLVFLVNTSDNAMLSQREGAIVRAEDARRNLENQVVFADRRIAQLQADDDPPRDDDGELITDLDEQRVFANSALRASRDRLARAEAAEQTWTRWAAIAGYVKFILPKTQETIGLLERNLISEEEMRKLIGESTGFDPGTDEPRGPAMSDPRAQQRVQEILRSRSLAWVLGTSLVFEALCLGLCVLIFTRRDF
ncbi:MAG: ABC transporter permease [Phycisphaerales bacterium]|nr:ABC transporter permease [Planctomycetota bacterium]MCH8508233.1 ABC transporter permease [Phycisphaerales bacterium]